MNAKQAALDAYLTRTAAIHWGHIGRVEAGLDELLAIYDGDGGRETKSLLRSHCRPFAGMKKPGAYPGFGMMVADG